MEKTAICSFVLILFTFWDHKSFFIISSKLRDFIVFEKDIIQSSALSVNGLMSPNPSLLKNFFLKNQ